MSKLMKSLPFRLVLGVAIGIIGDGNIKKDN